VDLVEIVQDRDSSNHFMTK